MTYRYVRWDTPGPRRFLLCPLTCPTAAAFPALTSNVAKLKKKAAEIEHKNQFDKALAVYVDLLGQLSGPQHDEDFALYNRVGDLMIRQGDVAQAGEYYEKAVDL